MTLTTEVRRSCRQDALDELQGLFRLEDEAAGELILARNARPATRFDGEAPPDPLLSCEGLDQAERLAERLASQWVAAVYTAPERRAFQTAKIVADHLGRPLQIIDALAEIGFAGPVSPDLGARFAAQPRWDSLPGFEEGRTFRRRVILAVERVLALNPARRVVVVTHASAINAYLSMLLGVPRDLFFAPDHASISVVRHEDGSYAVRSLNDTSHLARGGLLEAAVAPLTARSWPLTNR